MIAFAIYISCMVLREKPLCSLPAKLATIILSREFDPTKRRINLIAL
jgi:hypothetical protein